MTLLEPSRYFFRNSFAFACVGPSMTGSCGCSTLWTAPTAVCARSENAFTEDLCATQTFGRFAQSPVNSPFFWPFSLASRSRYHFFSGLPWRFAGGSSQCPSPTPSAAIFTGSVSETGSALGTSGRGFGCSTVLYVVAPTVCVPVLGSVVISGFAGSSSPYSHFDLCLSAGGFTSGSGSPNEAASVAASVYVPQLKCPPISFLP